MFFLFNLFALLTIVCAVGVVVNKNIVNSAMCLMLSLVGVAGLFVLLQAYLLAFVVVIVYAGAVAALFLFVVMLVGTPGGPRPAFKRVTIFASTLAAALLVVGVLTIAQQSQLALEAPAGPGVGASLKAYSYQLFTTYLLPVQIIGFLLLIAMLGVIALSKKHEVPEDAS
jgi:NADH-quinone oxidoreductase subunit J